MSVRYFFFLICSYVNTLTVEDINRIKKSEQNFEIKIYEWLNSIVNNDLKKKVSRKKITFNNEVNCKNSLAIDVSVRNVFFMLNFLICLIKMQNAFNEKEFFSLINIYVGQINSQLNFCKRIFKTNKELEKKYNVFSEFFKFNWGADQNNFVKILNLIDQDPIEKDASYFKQDSEVLKFFYKNYVNQVSVITFDLGVEEEDINNYIATVENKCRRDIYRLFSNNQCVKIDGELGTVINNLYELERILYEHVLSLKNAFYTCICLSKINFINLPEEEFKPLLLRALNVINVEYVKCFLICQDILKGKGLEKLFGKEWCDRIILENIDSDISLSNITALMSCFSDLKDLACEEGSKELDDMDKMACFVSEKNKLIPDYLRQPLDFLRLYNQNMLYDDDFEKYVLEDSVFKFSTLKSFDIRNDKIKVPLKACCNSKKDHSNENKFVEFVKSDFYFDELFCYLLEKKMSIGMSAFRFNMNFYFGCIVKAQIAKAFYVSAIFYSKGLVLFSVGLRLFEDFDFVVSMSANKRLFFHFSYLISNGNCAFNLDFGCAICK